MMKYTLPLPFLKKISLFWFSGFKANKAVYQEVRELFFFFLIKTWVLDFNIFEPILLDKYMIFYIFNGRNMGFGAKPVEHWF